MSKITCFEELHKKLDNYRADKRWFFRGHASSDWSLLPKAGRQPYNQLNDTTVFQTWKRQAVAYIQNRPQDEWEWLAVAQHHGLATRLLDWSSNPLVACFFAVRDQIAGDAVVYASKFRWTVPHDRRITPESYPNLAIFRANRIANRITNQSGIFSIHPNPQEPISKDNPGIIDLEEIRICESYRNNLRSQLSYYGINEATLFPDLDGISNHINWTIESREYWNFPNLEKE